MGRVRQFVKDTRENISLVKWLLSKSDTAARIRERREDVGLIRRMIFREFR
jgi:hypothetical protein